MRKNQENPLQSVHFSAKIRFVIDDVTKSGLQTSPLFHFEEKRFCFLTKREEYEAKAEEMLLPLMEEHSFELVDVEYVKEAGNWYLRAYVDKEGGITLDDCELVNRAWSDMMDENDFIEDAYILEVSSPGLGRQLKKEKDFKRSIGESVDVHFYQGHKIPSGKKGKEVSVKDVTGILTAYTPDTITIETDFDPAYEINRKEISTVKLTIDF